MSGLSASALVGANSDPRRFDWSDLRCLALDWGWPEADLAACGQAPDHHAEGDVAIHTRMVVEALVADPAWQELDHEGRSELLLAALCHDIAKPATATVEDGRIRNPGHAHVGERMARATLWRAGLVHDARERIAQAIRWHLHPFFLLERPDPARLAAHISWCVTPAHLAILARADASGRICADQQRILDAVALFEQQCAELGCLDAPFPFPSPAARMRWLAGRGEDPAYDPWFEPTCTMTVMSGLPGAGKDHWLSSIEPDLPVVSLDALRAELGVRPEQPQGTVIAAAKEQARVHLRAGRSFAWSATNITREMRGRVIGLGVDYGAEIRVVAMEAAVDVRARRNRDRDRTVPDAVVDRMVRRWEAPDASEAHQLVVVDES